ncbi:MAG: glycine cleavage system transcriptional repressor [Plesiomonas sp.]|uniref:glycine cleavage system transcriptional repressor n=1 Tax=Plesiomonas sp. TaxID=2486279 RepID=UPI003F2D12EB
MQDIQAHYLVLTALGADRPGIVNTITRHVSSCDCNIEDSRLALLGGEFTFIMLLSGSWNAIARIESTLPLIGAELDLMIVMKRTECNPKQPYPATVWVQIDVDDSAHIIEKFTDFFASRQLDIAELASKTVARPHSTPLLSIQIAAHSHISAPKQQTLIDDFHALCQKLGAQGMINLVLHTQPHAMQNS